MPALIQKKEICEFMERNLAGVFQTMLSMTAEPVGEPSHSPHVDRVSGALGFGGDAVTGALYVHVSTLFSVSITRAMLGMPEEETPGETDVNDVVAELTNMLGGGFKSWLSDTGAHCAMSTPSIIRGNSFEIEAGPGIERICRAFACGGETVLCEVHIKFD